jgi:predicted permease
MTAVLSSFLVVGSIIVLGYLLQRNHILGNNAELIITRLVFFVASPALLFTTVGRSKPADVFGPAMAVQVISVVAVIIVYVLFSILVWKQSWAQTVVGSMSSSYVNAGNLGIPLAAYVLGNAAQIAPILLFQLAIYTPIVMLLLELTSQRKANIGKSLLHAFANPILLASFAGVIVMVAHWHVPDVIMEPIQLLSGISVPGMLLTFGMSFAANRTLLSSGSTGPVATAVVLKNIVQPIIAFFLASKLFDLTAANVMACVVMAALPAAQNVYTYATRFGTGKELARDGTLITTLVSVPVIVVIAFLLS